MKGGDKWRGQGRGGGWDETRRDASYSEALTASGLA